MQFSVSSTDSPTTCRYPMSSKMIALTTAGLETLQLSLHLMQVTSNQRSGRVKFSKWRSLNFSTSWSSGAHILDSWLLDRPDAPLFIGTFAAFLVGCPFFLIELVGNTGQCDSGSLVTLENLRLKRMAAHLERSPQGSATSPSELVKSSTKRGSATSFGIGTRCSSPKSARAARCLLTHTRSVIWDTIQHYKTLEGTPRVPTPADHGDQGTGKRPHLHNQYR